MRMPSTLLKCRATSGRKPWSAKRSAGCKHLLKSVLPWLSALNNHTSSFCVLNVHTSPSCLVNSPNACSGSRSTDIQAIWPPRPMDLTSKRCLTTDRLCRCCGVRTDSSMGHKPLCNISSKPTRVPIGLGGSKPHGGAKSRQMPTVYRRGRLCGR